MIRPRGEGSSDSQGDYSKDALSKRIGYSTSWCRAPSPQSGHALEERE
jgi:hypothetical protein